MDGGKWPNVVVALLRRAFFGLFFNKGGFLSCGCQLNLFWWCSGESGGSVGLPNVGLS